MNWFSRGVRNAFRNVTRTVAIIVILGLSIGLCMVMLIARQTVQDKIQTTKASIGNTVTIQPAGFNSFSAANNSLTTSQLNVVSKLPHVTGLIETLTDRLTTIGTVSSPRNFIGQSNSTNTNQTSLKSPVKLSRRLNRGGNRLFVSGGSGFQLPPNFSLPIVIVGTNDPVQLNTANGNVATLVSGKFLNGNSDNNDAMVSQKMAQVNNLKLGSTFTAYSTQLTVVGIFASSSGGTNNVVVVSLPTEQRLSGQAGDVTLAVAKVDSIDNLSSTTAAIQKALGSSANVTSSTDAANLAIQPLNSVSKVALYSLIGAIVAASIIILMVMVMIVRERRKEIGVIKAIGSGNLRIAAQFMVEALTLTVSAAIIGIIIGAVASTPLTDMLVSNATTNQTSIGNRFGAGPVITRHFGGGVLGGLHRGISNIHAVVGFNLIGYGLAAAVVIALVGSALTAFIITKIRPSEVIRAE